MQLKDAIEGNLKGEFSAWIGKAESDLRKVRVLIDAGEFDGALFFAQHGQLVGCPADLEGTSDLQGLQL